MILQRFEALALLPPKKEVFQGQLEYTPKNSDRKVKIRRIFTLDDLTDVLDKERQVRLVYRKKEDAYYLKIAAIYLRCDKRKGRAAFAYYTGLSKASTRLSPPS